VNPKGVDVSAYLRRLRYDGPIGISLSTLRALHLAHLRTVPFENLDIHWSRPILLDEESLFDKIVTRKRGGFCYELNGLFASLLRELGYTVSLLSARVAGKDQRLGPEFDHLALRVDLDEPWLADVGFGDCFLEPLRLEDGYECAQAGVSYRLAQNARGEWALMTRKQGSDAWQLQYVFTLIPRRLPDFAEMCAWQQTSPESHFTRTRVCTRVTEQGRITVSDNRLIITELGNKREREIDSDTFRELLMEEFGITDQRNDVAAGR
jgi:N-hydroxyarylamine O-acetyltransferase